ncbi:MAG: hypothetical protein ABI867_07580 [Kofleriaceae bacterium]
MVKVTAATITDAQIRKLVKLSTEAGDDGMVDLCKIALDAGASTRKRKAAREECASLHNDLAAIKKK